MDDAAVAARTHFYLNPFFVRGCFIALQLGGATFRQYYDGEPEITEWIDARIVSLWELFQQCDMIPTIEVPHITQFMKALVNR